MAKSDVTTVDAYIAAQPEAARAVLRQVRRAIAAAVPAAEEVISYRIPAFRLPGGIVLFFAGWKEHYALYPVGGDLIRALKGELEPYELSYKGTVRFPLDAPVPTALIRRIAKHRAAEVAAPKAPKRKAVKKAPRKKTVRSKR